MRKSRLVVLLVAALALSLGVAACGSSDSDSSSSDSADSSTSSAESAESAGGTETAASDEELVIGISELGLNFPYNAAMSEAFKAKADELGVRLIETDAQGNPEKQADDVQDLITQKPDGLILVPVNGEQSQALADRVRDAGIPEIAVGTQVGAPGRDIDDVYPALDALVLQDEVKTGELIGEEVLRVLPDGGKVAIVTGPPGYNEVGWRKEGFERVLRANPAFEIVAEQPGDWDPKKGEAACQNMLAANPDLALIYSQEDNMGIGCQRAVRAAGSDALVMTNSGGTRNGVDMVRNGTIAASICFQPRTVAEVALEVMVQRLRDGRLPKRYYDYPTPLITRANLDDCVPQW